MGNVLGKYFLDWVLAIPLVVIVITYFFIY